MGISFKQFNSYVSDQLSEEQLDEIFGVFGSKKDDVKDKLQQAKDKLKTTKDAQWAAAKAKAEAGGQRFPVPPRIAGSKPDKNNLGNAKQAELDWIKQHS
jgi:hypothetical protein